MKLFFRFLLLEILFTPFQAAIGQVQNQNEVTVEISKEKAVIKGVTYYLHTVKKGETIYRISRTYGITQKDLLAANHDAISGPIKEGQRRLDFLGLRTP